MPRISQEFYCQGCTGYILIPLNDQTTYHVTVHCPKCAREHSRVIRNGCIEEAGRYSASASEVLYPTLAAWSATPRTKLMEEATKRPGRPGDAAVIRTPEDLVKGSFARESWFERNAHKVYDS